MKNKLTLFVISTLSWGCSSATISRKMASVDFPKAFIALSDVDPTILQEMRYSGSHNFLGKQVNGYYADKCILTREAAAALRSAQEELEDYSMTLKVYDCYRPQKSVNAIVDWATDLADERMKNEFYPEVEKKDLLKEGYIPQKSDHSRGSALDVTIVPLPVPRQPKFRDRDPLTGCQQPTAKRFKDNMIDFGTGFDCFDPLAQTENPGVGALQKRNRLLLKVIMEKYGFKNSEEEWWHYTLKSEPFPTTYFDFIVQ